MDPKDIIEINGLSGKKLLQGKIHIHGAKNDSLKAICASILFDGDLIIENVPNTADVRNMLELLRGMGASISFEKNILKINTRDIANTNFDLEIARSMRASVVLTGPIIARFGKVNFPNPGGCVIGNRPIDLFLNGYKKMGCSIVQDEKNNMYEIEVRDNGLKETEIFFPFQTVGGTETLMLASILAKGKTVLKNCALEPEIHSLAEFLVNCGANISGIGTTTLKIQGTDGKLLKANNSYKITPDRIEAGSYLLLGAIAGKNIEIVDCNTEHMESVINFLIDANVPLTYNKNSIRIKQEENNSNTNFKANSIRIHEYPGFPTDLQAQISVFLALSSGESTVFETIYENRFKHVENLRKLGANITIMNPREIFIKGGSTFKSSSEVLDAYDLRAGFAAIMSAVVAEGVSKIANTKYIDRGYEDIYEILRSLGVGIGK